MKKIEPLVEPDLAPLTPSPEKEVGGMGEAPKYAAAGEAAIGAEEIGLHIHFSCYVLC